MYKLFFFNKTPLSDCQERREYEIGDNKINACRA